MLPPSAASLFLSFLFTLIFYLLFSPPPLICSFVPEEVVVVADGNCITLSETVQYSLVKNSMEQILALLHYELLPESALALALLFLSSI